MSGIRMKREGKKTGDVARHTDTPHSRKQRATGATGGGRARALEAREGEAYACVRVRVRRRRLNASSKTGNKRLRALVVVSRRRPGLHVLPPALICALASINSFKRLSYQMHGDQLKTIAFIHLTSRKFL